MMFEYDREDRTLLCSFCREGYMGTWRGFASPLSSLLFHIVVAIMFLLFAVMFSFMTGMMLEWEDEINGTETTGIENVTADGEFRVFGRIDSNGTIALRTIEIDGVVRNRVRNNFTLRQGDRSLFVIVTNGTEGYRVDNAGNDTVEFGDGDLVYVVGEGVDRGGNVSIHAKFLLDGDYDNSEGRAWATVFTWIFIFGAVSMIAVSAYHALAPSRFGVRSIGDVNSEPMGGAGSDVAPAADPPEGPKGRTLQDDDPVDVEKLKAAGTRNSFPRRRILQFLFIFLMIIDVLLMLVFFAVMKFIDKDESGVEFIMGVGMVMLIPLLFTMVCLDSIQKELRSLTVGEYGILLERETIEPYVIPWTIVDNLIIHGKIVKILLKGDHGWRFMVPKHGRDVLRRHWMMVDMERRVERSQDSLQT